MSKIRKYKLIKLIIAIMLLSIILLNNVTLAATLSNSDIKKLEYSDEYKEWLSLPEDERAKVMMPNMYDIKIETDNSEYLNSLDNVFKLTTLLGASASASDTSFDLRGEIPENLIIKDQGTTGGCWAFAMAAALETHFARQDKEEGETTTEYDFSERHMVYATAREAFLNDAINKKGFTKVIAGGNQYLAEAYMTNGSGLIIEDEMPFENNENKIDIKEIQDKNVITTLVDSEYLGSPKTEEEKTAIIKDIKQHISQNGGVWARLHGAQLENNCYNNATGAIYTNNSTDYPMNHAVLIVGWNDNYSKENFNESLQPQNNGAWIIKNSWGTQYVLETVTNLKEVFREILYEKFEADFNSQNIYSADQIPDSTLDASFESSKILESFIESKEEIYGKNKVIVDGDEIIVKVGDNGFMYVSYEDANIMKSLYKIVNAKNYKDYDNIYQYNYLGTNDLWVYSISSTVTKGYIATIFENKSNEEELTKISLSTMIPYEQCRVYINPNGSSKKFDDLQLVDLKEGEYEKIEAGYNTIEFANPIKLTGSSFVVVLELSIDTEGYFIVPVNIPSNGNFWENVDVATDKSFIGTEFQMKNDTWTNVSSATGENPYNLTIKAFTDNIKEETLTLSSIKVTQAPKNLTYNVGDKFDKTGMVVNAKYTNGTEKAVENYKVTNGDSLELGQKSVTISYTENGVTKTTTQAITVNKPAPTLTKIEVKTAPKKLEYTQNKDNLDLTGGVITATYSDNTTKDITMTNSEVKVTGYDKTKVGKQILTVTYNEKTTTFEVTVKAEETEPTPEEVTLTKIEIKTKPKKLEYTQNKDNLDLTGGIITATYSDKTTKDISMTSTEVKVTGYDKTKVGKQTITVTYQGKTTTFEITVKEVQKRTPTLSNFEKSKANITKATSYIYIKKDKEDYSTMTIKLDGVERGDNVSSREFYYYLSGNKGETNISSSNWTKFTMNSNEDIYSANLNIDTRNVKNASEIAESESLYIYIKEVATLDGNTTETVNTINIKKVVDVEVYLDDVKQSDINIDGSNTNTPNDEKEDNTTAKDPIPQTGITTIGMIILAIIGIAIVSYIKYRNIDR